MQGTMLLDKDIVNERRVCVVGWQTEPEPAEKIEIEHGDGAVPIGTYNYWKNETKLSANETEGENGQQCAWSR